MPEGPSILILKELLQLFEGKIIQRAEGNTKVINPAELTGQKIVAVRSWGKHLLICLPHFTIKIHLMLYGTYRINSRKDTPPRLSLQFAQGEVNFYTCSVSKIEFPLDEIYDWPADIMSKAWSNDHALKKLNAQAQVMVCDALLDQHIFSGSGNIIKNEVLFRIGVHPLSLVGALPPEKLNLLVRETVVYGYQFYTWRKAFELKKHWQVYHKRFCPRDNTMLEKGLLGKTRRRTYYCPLCQILYA